jgi:glucosamine--fructose-6-phosphate aminotransferase (isomerizing)
MWWDNREKQNYFISPVTLFGFMATDSLEREIEDGVRSIRDTIAEAPSIRQLGKDITQQDTVTFVGCGSSYWVGTIGAARFRRRGIQASTVHASELLSSCRSLATVGDVVIGCSQSGRTAETIDALEQAAGHARTTIAVTNTPESPLAEVADRSYITPAGEESAVLATKSVVAAVTALTVLAADDGEKAIAAPDQTAAVLEHPLAPVVERLVPADRCFTIGSELTYGLAGEIGLKLLEGPQIHTISLPTFEIAHGPMAAVDGVPIVYLPHPERSAERVASLVQDLCAAGAEPLVVSPRTFAVPDSVVTVRLPTSGLLSRLIYLQRVCRETALRRNVDPVSPPNLSKFVEQDIA